MAKEKSQILGMLQRGGEVVIRPRVLDVRWPLAHDSAVATLVIKGAVQGVAFSRDGGRLASRGPDATVRCWAVPGPIEADAGRVSYRVRAMTSLEFDEGDAIRPMDGPPGWDLRRRLDHLGGPPLR